MTRRTELLALAERVEAIEARRDDLHMWLFDVVSGVGGSWETLAERALLLPDKAKEIARETITSAAMERIADASLRPDRSVSALLRAMAEGEE